MKLIEMRVVCGSKNKRSQKCYRYRYGEGRRGLHLSQREWVTYIPNEHVYVEVTDV
jgi:hypothetical protein